MDFHNVESENEWVSENIEMQRKCHSEFCRLYKLSVTFEKMNILIV